MGTGVALLKGEMSPTSRSLNLLRKESWLVAVVEKWIPGANIRRDLFGFADLLAFHPTQKRFLLVQTTTAAHLANRLNKVKSRAEAGQWSAAGGLIEVHGWALKNGRWEVKRVALIEGMMAVVVADPPRQRRPKKWGQPVLF